MACTSANVVLHCVLRKQTQSLWLHTRVLPSSPNTHTHTSFLPASPPCTPLRMDSNKTKLRSPTRYAGKWQRGGCKTDAVFCLQLEASCLQWSFLLTGVLRSFLVCTLSFLLTARAFFTYSWSFFAYSWKALLISNLMDCLWRSSTVSKKLHLYVEKLPRAKRITGIFREEHSMDRYWCRPELSERFGVWISGEIRMDQWPLCHVFREIPNVWTNGP